MKKSGKILTIYIINQHEFIIADSKKRLRNKYSLELENKQIEYNKEKKEVEIINIYERKSSCNVSIKNICQVTESEYLGLLNQRREEVQLGWQKQKKILEIMSPYIEAGVHIPEHIKKERDEKINSIPKPDSLLELILKKSFSNNENLQDIQERELKSLNHKTLRVLTSA